MADTATLITQLRALEHLTRTEAQIARIRVAQARTDAVRRELAENAENADRRAGRIAAALRTLGAVPDVVSPALGRVSAFVKGTVEQAQPLDEALLGDLALEHQLLDRARYVKVLAQRAERPDVEELADDLVTAHSATVDWLTTVLAEEALGGPAALRATPLQWAAGGVTKAVNLPAKLAIEQFNRVFESVQRAGEEARATFEEYASRVMRLGAGVTVAAKEGAKDTAEAAGDAVQGTAVETRDAVQGTAAATRDVVGKTADAAGETAGSVLEQSERAAEQAGEAVASATEDLRREAGDLQASDLPIQHYEEMTGQGAIAAIRGLTSADDVQTMIRWEETHRNRSSVVSAAQTRYAAIAKQAVGVD